MVLRENGRWPWRYAQDDDRGFGAQATDCILATCHDGCSAAPVRDGSGRASYRGAARDVECWPLRRADHDEERQTRSAGRLPKMWMDEDPYPHSPPVHGVTTSARQRADEGDRGHSAASKPRHVRHLRKGRSDPILQPRPYPGRERAMTGAHHALAGKGLFIRTPSLASPSGWSAIKSPLRLVYRRARS